MGDTRHAFRRDGLDVDRPGVWDQRFGRTEPSIMPPIFFDFPDDERTEEIEDQHMFGNDVLVAPALEAGKKECMTCLPARIERVYAWSGKLVQGGQEVMAQFCST